MTSKACSKHRGQSATGFLNLRDLLRAGLFYENDKKSYRAFFNGELSNQVQSY